LRVGYFDISCTPDSRNVLRCVVYLMVCRAVLQMSVDTVEAELQKAMRLQASTSAALAQAVQDKLKAEAQLSTAMVRPLVCPSTAQHSCMRIEFPACRTDPDPS
jgi:hypothetical protein